MSDESFISLLRDWLAANELTPTLAAPLLGVGRTAVHAWLAGEYLPPATRVAVLSRALGVTEERLRPMLERPSRRHRATIGG